MTEFHRQWFACFLWALRLSLRRDPVVKSRPEPDALEHVKLRSHEITRKQGINSINER